MGKRSQSDQARAQRPTSPRRRELLTWLTAGFGLSALPACKRRQPAPQSSKAAPPTTAATLQTRTISVEVSHRGRSFRENAYLLFNELTRDAVLIDPGAVDPRIEAAVKHDKLTVRGILNTHGHPDHIGGNAHYAERYGVTVTAHEADRPLYARYAPGVPPPGFLTNTQHHLSVAGIGLTMIPTPGHTPGSVCFHAGDQLFSGDTLFRGSIGRTFGDTAAGRARDTKQEIASIRQGLLTLADRTQVHPGHGSATTIGRERRENRFLKTPVN